MYIQLRKQTYSISDKTDKFIIHLYVRLAFQGLHQLVCSAVTVKNTEGDFSLLVKLFLQIGKTEYRVLLLLESGTGRKNTNVNGLCDNCFSQVSVPKNM